MPEIFIQHTNFKNDILYELLEAGWFRMGERMFTTDVVVNNQNIAFPVHWLRYNIPYVTDAFYNKRNYKKLRRQYTVAHLPLHEADKDELEALFVHYTAHTKFEHADFLGDVLGGYSDKFDTQVIQVRDGATLIAAGMIDTGENCIAAIKNIYNLAYAKEGLGIFLLMEAVRYCQIHDIEWLYPGYIAPGYPNFDYKIYPQFSEVFLAHNLRWVPYVAWHKKQK